MIRVGGVAVSIDDLYLILGLLVPGLIVLFVRSQFTTGRYPSHSAMLLNYFVVTVIYYALVLAFVASFPSPDESIYVSALAWFALTFAGPAMLGLFLGINVQKNWFRRVLQWGGLNPVHVMPTAWDWKFGGMSREWVLVTLKDGTRFAGFCGPESFISSDPTERDIYIQQIYEIDDQNKWSSSSDKGVLIVADQVQTIEFWPIPPQERSNG